MQIESVLLKTAGVANVMSYAGRIARAVHTDENVKINCPFQKPVAVLPWPFSQFATDFPERDNFDIRDVDAGLQAYCPQSLVVLALPPNAVGTPAPFNLTRPIYTATRESFAACSDTRQF